MTPPTAPSPTIGSGTSTRPGPISDDDGRDTAIVEPGTAVDEGAADDAPRRSRTLRRTGRAVVGLAPPAAVFAIVIGVWYAVSYLVLEPRRRFLLPPPHRVISVGFFDERNRTELLTALAQSTQVALWGLAIAIAVGTLLAVAMSQARWVERSLYPWAVVLQTIPVLALVPLIGFWFQYGFSSRVLVCVLVALFPIVTNTLFGLKSADRSHRDLFRLHHATRLQTLRLLQIPGALPATLTGWRTSAGLSVIGAIVGDFFFRQGPVGIGRLLDVYTANLQSAQLFAAVALSSLLGLTVFWGFGLLNSLLVGPWHDSADEAR